MFANMRTGHGSWYAPEFAADFHRRQRLGIEGVQLTHPASRKEQDDRLGPAKTLINSGKRRQRREMASRYRTEPGQGADTQPFPSRKPAS